MLNKLKKLYYKIKPETESKKIYTAKYYICYVTQKEVTVAESQFTSFFSSCSAGQFKTYIKILNAVPFNEAAINCSIAAFQDARIQNKFWRSFLSLTVKDQIEFLELLDKVPLIRDFYIDKLSRNYSAMLKFAKIKSTDPIKSRIPLKLKIVAKFYTPNIGGGTNENAIKETKKWHDEFDKVTIIGCSPASINLSRYQEQQLAFFYIDKNSYTRNELKNNIRLAYYNRCYKNPIIKMLFKYLLPWTKESTEYYSTQIKNYRDYWSIPMYKRELDAQQEKVKAERSNNLVVVGNSLIDTSRLSENSPYIKEQSENEKRLYELEVIDAEDYWRKLTELPDRAKKFDESIKNQAISNKAKFFKFYNSSLADPSVHGMQEDLQSDTVKSTKTFGLFPAASDKEKAIKKHKCTGLLDSTSESDDAEEILGGAAYSKSLSKS